MHMVLKTLGSETHTIADDQQYCFEQLVDCQRQRAANSMSRRSKIIIYCRLFSTQMMNA